MDEFNISKHAKLSADAALWRAARDFFEIEIERADATDAEWSAAGDAKQAIATRICGTPALTMADIPVKLAIVRDCYEGLADLDACVTDRGPCGRVPMAESMALSVCADLLRLTALPAD